MTENKCVEQAPVQLEDLVKYSLSFSEIDTLAHHCDIMKDFEHTKLINTKKLHKNFEILSRMREVLRAEAVIYEQRRVKLLSMEGETGKTDKETEDLFILKQDLAIEIMAFNAKKYDISLYIIPHDVFPEEDEKYGMNLRRMADGQVAEYPYRTSFTKLFRTIIIL